MPPPTPEEQEIIQHIRAHLTGTSPLSAIVSALAEPIESAYTAGEVEPPQPRSGQSTETRLWTLWYSIIHLAKETPHRDSATQTALVNLVAALKSRPNPPRPHGRDNLKTNWVWHGSGELWSDLVLFGASMRETWNDAPTALRPSDSMTVAQWTNLNAFAARATAAGVADFLLYAIWSMRPALEAEATASKLDALLPASAMWIECAGRKLYESEEEWPVSPTRGNPAGGGPLWTGKSGLCGERWRLWKGMFEHIKERSDVQKETREFAADALEVMGGIERGR